MKQLIKKTKFKYIFTITVIYISILSCDNSISQPQTRIETVIDTIHGVAFEDPYRWLEDRYSKETLDWIEKQNVYAEKVIGNSTFRKNINKRLHELSTYDPFITPTEAGDYQYFTYRPKNSELPIIFRRKTPSDKNDKNSPIDLSLSYETVLDPNGKTPENTLRYSIAGFSNSGDLMAYSVRDGGEDEIKIRIYDVINHVELPDSLPWSLYNHSGGFTFDKSDLGFYYVKRSRIDGPRVMYHKVGTELEQDIEIFGSDYGPESFISANYVEDGKYLIFTVQHGWFKSEIHFKDLNNAEGNSLKVEDFISMASSYEELANSSDAILILTEWDEFKKIEWSKISKLMRKPSWIFDCRDIIDLNDFKESDLNIWKLGLGTNVDNKIK